MGVKTGPRLLVDYLITHQLVGMAGFWAAVPADVEAELRVQAEAACQVATDAAMGKACAGCGTIRTVMTPIHNALWTRLGELHAALPEALAPVVAFLASKRGYRPTPIDVYYKDVAGGTRVLRV